MNVRPFAELGLDGPRGGRWQELLARARWSATSPTSGVNVPDGFATTAEAYRRFIGDTGLAEEISAQAEGTSTPTTPASWPRWVARSARRWPPATSPRTSRPDIRAAFERARRRARRRVLRGTLERDRRGPAGRVVRRSAGDLPQHQGHRRGAPGDPRGLRLALQRPRDRLPGAPRLRPRRGRALGRRAADGPLRHRRVRGDVHDGHRVRLRRRGVHHLGVRPGRGGRAGRGEPRRVLRLQAGAAGGPSGDPQARGRRQGHQDDLHRRPGGRPHHGVRGHRREPSSGCSA